MQIYCYLFDDGLDEIQQTVLIEQNCNDNIFLFLVGNIISSDFAMLQTCG